MDDRNLGSIASHMRQSVLPSGAGGVSGAGGGVGEGMTPPPPPTLQVFPWWFYPAPASQYFYVDTLDDAGAAQVIAPGAQNVALAGAQLRVNKNERAVIVSISLVAQLPTPTDNYFFTLLRNGGPVEGLRRLRNFAVAANASVRDFAGFAVKLEPGDLMTWTVTNNGGAAVTVALNYQGWRTNVNEIERIQQGANV